MFLYFLISGKKLGFSKEPLVYQRKLLLLKRKSGLSSKTRKGWSGGVKVLGKLPVPGRPTNLDYSRARAYCACIR